MVVISSPLPRAAAAVVAASAIAALPSTQSLSITTSSQKIPSYRPPPKSLSSLSSTRGYQSSHPERGSSRRKKKGRGRQQQHQPLRAYTVADNNNKPSWVSFLRRPMRRPVTMDTPFAELSQFGRMEMEGTFTDRVGGY